MSALEHAPNIKDIDGFYAQLLRAHKELGEQGTAALNAHLVLILANHIGERGVLDEALALASKTAKRTIERANS